MHLRGGRGGLRQHERGAPLPRLGRIAPAPRARKRCERYGVSARPLSCHART
jgi:hypothetical protein